MPSHLLKPPRLSALFCLLLLLPAAALSAGNEQEAGTESGVFAEPGLPLVPEEDGEEVPSSPFRLVVLDPGHGGGDTGAVGSGGVREKDLALQVATRLRILLEQEAIEVALTRDADVEVPVDDRTSFANQLRADLFVSLHANASAVLEDSGAETWFLTAEATDEMGRKVTGSDPGSRGRRNRRLRRSQGALDMTLWEMAQKPHLEDSRKLASGVQSELNTLLDTPDRHAQQGPLTVLMGASMPAVLIEIGFLSNPDEEKLLQQAAHQQKIAESLASAILAFGKERQTLRAAGGKP